MIQKKKLRYPTLDSFLSMKRSTSWRDDAYVTGSLESEEPIAGEPDISYDATVYIASPPCVWTAGVFIKGSQYNALEPEDFETLRAADCEEGVLYLQLGEVIDTEGQWGFGDGFPIRFT